MTPSAAPLMQGASAAPLLPMLWDLFVHCLGLSLLAIGGAVATAPDLRRFVVSEQGWISSADFTSGMALAQAAPGPNLLFVAVIGFQVAGLPGAFTALLGMSLPSTVLTLTVARWGAQRRHWLGVRAFVAGMAPVTLGLILATGLLLAQPVLQAPAEGWAAAHAAAASVWPKPRAALGGLLMTAMTLLAWRSKLSPLWLIGSGALAGALGLV